MMTRIHVKNHKGRFAQKQDHAKELKKILGGIDQLTDLDRIYSIRKIVMVLERTVDFYLDFGCFGALFFPVAISKSS